MYQPPHFRIEDREALLGVIRLHPLGLLITAGPAGLMANPIPFVLAEERGLLLAHLARANPQWQEIAAGARPLVVFQSVEHYVSPSWYATKQETHKVVPTWNYVVVQVSGSARIMAEDTDLRAQVDALTAAQESHRPAPWQVSDAPAPFIAAQMRAIVGIEIAMEEITGKFKLSQNRSEADMTGVVDGLSSENAADAAEMREMIAAHLARRRA